jgi:hypothetical protein
MIPKFYRILMEVDPEEHDKPRPIECGQATVGWCVQSTKSYDRPAIFVRPHEQDTRSPVEHQEQPHGTRNPMLRDEGSHPAPERSNQEACHATYGHDQNCVKGGLTNLSGYCCHGAVTQRPHLGPLATGNDVRSETEMNPPLH